MLEYLDIEASDRGSEEDADSENDSTQSTFFFSNGNADVIEVIEGFTDGYSHNV